MSEFKGTPGPWSFNHNSASDEVTFCINVVANGVSEICYLQSQEEYLPSRVHTVANANLIAAAPELLECCLRIQAQFHQAGVESKAGSLNPVEDNAAQIDAAIAKALGQ